MLETSSNIHRARTEFAQPHCGTISSAGNRDRVMPLTIGIVVVPLSSRTQVELSGRKLGSWHPHQPASVVKKTKPQRTSTKLPLSQSHKRRCVACQHSHNDQTQRLQAGAGEDDVNHLPSGSDRAACERRELDLATAKSGRPEARIL